MALVAVTGLMLATAGAAQAAVRSATPCRAIVSHGIVPAWARAGFSEKQPRSAQVLGRAGQIDAILFADPLLAAPAKTGAQNKILWVSRPEVGVGTTLRISAQRMHGTRVLGKPVGRVVPGGPGPSIIDLPAAGCWRLSLHWSGHSDSVDLRYRTRTP